MVSLPGNERFVVSACLTGADCTFRGGNNLNTNVKKIADSGACVAVCPEVLGGLGIPRARIEISGGDGNDVLNGAARAVDEHGLDVTREMLKGARIALEKARAFGAKKAILKSNSPSCGAGTIYDGSFSNRTRTGYGIFAALLAANGISATTETDI
jgi:uncharacterized protein YbbK (DUF523 family)